MLTKWDSRISYDLTNTDYFKLFRVSNPILSDPRFPIEITGKYRLSTTKTSNADQITIAQTSVTLVSVYSNTYDKFWIPSIDLNPQSVNGENASSTILIPELGISFRISSPISFTATSNKTWQFIVEAPYQYNVSALVDQLRSQPGAVENMLSYNASADYVYFENLWRHNTNDVYAFIGLLICYLFKLNNL